MPDFVRAGDGRGDVRGQAIVRVGDDGDAHRTVEQGPRRCRRVSADVGYTAKEFWITSRTRSGGQHFLRLVIDVPVLADDHDVELVGDAVGAGDARAIVGDDEGDVGLDHAVAFGEGGDEDDLLAGKLLVDLLEILEPAS